MALLELGCCSWTISSASLALSFWALAVKMTFAMTTSLLHVVSHVCLGRLGSSLSLSLSHVSLSLSLWISLSLSLSLASRPSPRVSEESSRPYRALQICLRTIWSSSSCLLTLKSSFRPPLLIALALISIRLPLKSPLHLMLIAFVAGPVVIASWTFAYHIGLGSSRPLRSMNDYSGHGSQLPFVRTPLNDLLLAKCLTTIRTLC